jgi:thermolysin
VLYNSAKNLVKEEYMKKIGALLLFILFGLAFLESAYVGKVYVKSNSGDRLGRIMVAPQPRSGLQMLRAGETGARSLLQGKRLPTRTTTLGSPSYITREVSKGNLKLKRTETDVVARMVHRRYTQFYMGLEVLGGQVIQHFKSGRLVSTTGEYYEAINIDTTPLIDANSAIWLYRIHLSRPEDPEKQDSSKLIICPVNDQDYRLAYQIIARNGHQYSMTGILDAKSGEIIKEYSNIQTQDLTIGVGIGLHGQQFKLPSTYQNNSYYLADLSKARPVDQYTFDFRTGAVATDADNDWLHDGALVNVHAYMGLSYDYFYSVFGRHGIDDASLGLGLISIVHYAGRYDNAFWSDEGMMYFCEPGLLNYQTAAALDVISHEYSHGVTQFTSALEYYCDSYNQPGALSESFSDIMGTAIESYWQPAGQGFDRSDWVVGEDIYAAFSASNYFRSLSDPNSKSDVFYGYSYLHPCHLSQCYVFPITEEGDYGGVHFLATLYGHAYYLLAAGGTNRVSGLSVTGIGIDKATKIFFRAWTYYLTPTANFLQAANALAQSAYDLYGGSSNEYTQSLNAMVAIGWSLN